MAKVTSCRFFKNASGNGKGLNKMKDKVPMDNVKPVSGSGLGVTDVSTAQRLEQPCCIRNTFLSRML